MKLTTICDVSHLISYTRPSSPLFFSGDIERKAWERGYPLFKLDIWGPLVRKSVPVNAKLPDFQALKKNSK